jgi:large subunit ribosomal protein L18
MSKLVGEAIAKIATEKWITTVVFDRGWFSFHWRVKALADSAKEAWLQF